MRGLRPATPSCYFAGMVLEPEPVLVTDPTLMEVLAELRAREPLFHRRELGTTRSHFEAMTPRIFGRWVPLGVRTAASTSGTSWRRGTSAQMRMCGRPATSTAAESV